MAKRILWALAGAPMAFAGCSSSDSDLPTEPPTSVTLVTSGGFSSPTDAVSSPDGKTFYFAAIDSEKNPAIFETSSAPGSTAEVLATGAPLASPMGLVMGCDGKTVYVADLAATSEDGEQVGAVLAIPTAGGAITDLQASGIERPAGLALAKDCKTLYITGRTTDGKPGLFQMSIDGGTASVVYAGDPLISPTGLHVDTDGVSWVMDHLAHGTNGAGVLWSIVADGSAATEVASGLEMGTPGGVSLTAGGGTAVMPTRDADGNGQLTTVSISSGEVSQLATPDITDPAGLRTAKGAGVFAIVDSEGGAIYRAE